MNFPPLSSVYSEAHGIFTSSSTTELKICTPGVVVPVCTQHYAVGCVYTTRVCVCVREREREKDREGEVSGQRQRVENRSR